MRRKSNGFTLLEVLVSLVVLGMILAGLEQGLHFGLTASKRSDSNIRRAADLEATDRVLRNLLGHVDLGDNASDADQGFKGTSDSLSFPGLLPSGVTNESHAEMTLLVDDRHRLVLRWRLAPHVLAPEPAPTAATEILDHVDHVEFSYGSAGLDNGWKSTWSATTPPKLVRVMIILTQDRSTPWPALIIALPTG